MECHQRRQRRSTKLFHLLKRRERYGVRQTPNTIRFSGIPGTGQITRDELLSSSAWNVSNLQNMILAVGPGTPASILMGPQTVEFSPSSDSSSEDDGTSFISHTEDIERPFSEEISSRVGISETRSSSDVASAAVTVSSGPPRTRPIGNNIDSQEEESTRIRSSDDNSPDETNDENPVLGRFHIGYRRGRSESSEGDSNEIESINEHSSETDVCHSSKCFASMKHGGCINTATWLACPWRLSYARTEDNSFLDSMVISSSHSSNVQGGFNERKEGISRVIASSECPTQIITSGDDKMVKFWDVSASMGSLSPAVGPTTVCPFAFTDKRRSKSSIIKEWRRTYKGAEKLPGMVNLLASVRSGHRGNVFDASPLWSKPGKILTCAADGNLNLCDIETHSISTIIGPTNENMERSELGMCFSHHMLNENTGLLCCETGLRRFDLRLPRHSQPLESLLGPGNEMCKSCAVYSASESESAYVFAGGSSDVALYDLRFTDESTKVVQIYRPSCFPASAEVSVSGIDVSRDKKELLVSYENDQIYTFPIFPSSVADPTIDELLSLSKDRIGSTFICKNHLAGYGGHLNRFTFLKSAKYAGPNDEYICTGSDSGHAVIYSKYNGSVTSFLKADKSTCNGIVPHPVLPLFITYGISSSAKLWRASMPIDDEVDDSVRGRRKAYHSRDYEKSIIVSNWKEVQASLSKLCIKSDTEETDAILFPNEVGLQNTLDGHGFGGLPSIIYRRLFHDSPFKTGADSISNDLISLPKVITNDYFEAVRALYEEDEPPVQCGLDEFHRRISLIRLHHQASQLGLTLDPQTPWKFESDDIMEEGDPSYELEELTLADLCPANPGDWIPYDRRFASEPAVGGRAMNGRDYGDFYRLRYCDLEGQKVSSNGVCHNTYEGEQRKEGGDENESENKNDFDASAAWDVLHETIAKLKEGGNTALKNGHTKLAASYYDKALTYCSAAFMEYPQTTLDFIDGHQELLKENGGNCIRWSAILKTFITTRMNLSMTLLKLSDPKCAATQALLSLRQLSPFCAAEGLVLTGRNLQHSRENEPFQTFREAKELQAKAYFRLGSAKLQSGDFKVAIRNFERCMESTKEIHPDAKPERLVVNGLNEARRLDKKKRNKRRKQFKFAFTTDDQEVNDNKKHASS